VGTNYREGHLITIRSHREGILCVLKHPQRGKLKQVKEYKQRVLSGIPRAVGKSYDSLEEKLGLIVKVSRNKLDQPQGYEVQIGQDVLFFKYVLAIKYFELVGDQGDEERRSCKV